MGDANGTTFTFHHLVEETLRAQGLGGGQQCWRADRSVRVYNVGIKIPVLEFFSSSLGPCDGLPGSLRDLVPGHPPAYESLTHGMVSSVARERQSGIGLNGRTSLLLSKSPEVSSLLPWQGGS